jgi:hypothetical protein
MNVENLSFVGKFITPTTLLMERNQNALLCSILSNVFVINKSRFCVTRGLVGYMTAGDVLRANSVNTYNSLFYYTNERNEMCNLNVVHCGVLYRMIDRIL